MRTHGQSRVGELCRTDECGGAEVRLGPQPAQEPNCPLWIVEGRFPDQSGEPVVAFSSGLVEGVFTGQARNREHEQGGLGVEFIGDAVFVVPGTAIREIRTVKVPCEARKIARPGIEPEAPEVTLTCAPVQRAAAGPM
ncbi:hypothetical protein [Amycolatopsis sacchari]|uniref:hypothetical protein n=1 Tax=Amycolatopsis sacchari TaxID=115433 RepID=UPI003EBB9380